MRLSLRAVALVAAIVAIDLVCIIPWRGNLALREISDRSAMALGSEPKAFTQKRCDSTTVAGAASLSSLSENRRPNRA